MAALEAALEREPADIWVERLGRAKVPCGPVNDIAGGFALAEALGLDPIREMASAAGDVVRQAASPIKMSATPVAYRSTRRRWGSRTPSCVPGSRTSEEPLFASPEIGHTRYARTVAETATWDCFGDTEPEGSSRRPRF